VVLSRGEVVLLAACEELTGARGLFWFASRCGVLISTGDDGGDAEVGRVNFPFSSRIALARGFVIV
jgi:hypothetical protein